MSDIKYEIVGSDNKYKLQINKIVKYLFIMEISEKGFSFQKLCDTICINQWFEKGGIYKKFIKC